MSLKTKTAIGILLSVYFFSHSFTQWIFGFSSNVYAAEEIHENIIAVFVDKNIYDKHKGEINWYAQEYLQSQSSNTKALLLPLDKNNFQAYDIWKVLENLYQEGAKDNPSSLIGTILIGDLPLPVIRENSYIYPSIYPYTDLEKPSYVYDPASTYFITEENGDHKADIRQSVINFQDQDDQYTKFFDKLRTYKQNPTNYTSTKIWYDDFIGLKKYFADQFLSGYINNFLFHEDINYHRYTNLIFDYFKDAANNNALSLIGDDAKKLSPDEEAYSELGTEGSTYKKEIDKWKEGLSAIAADSSETLETLGSETAKIPTLMMGTALLSLVQPYTSLFAPEYLTNIDQNIIAGGRWNASQVDSHIKKTVVKDTLTSTALFDANTVLEKALYQKLQTGNYALHIPIPLLYEEYECVPVPPVLPPDFVPKKLAGRYENFYYGKSAFEVTSTNDISIYRGTWKNIGSRQNLTSYNYTTQGQQDDIPVDYTARSIGASYGIASRQVESSRGYNIDLISKDIDLYNARKCNDRQTLEDFVNKYRGGMTPLNVDGNTLKLKQNDPKMAWNPRFDTTIGGPVYDIAGSKLTLKKMNADVFFLDELNNSLLHRTQQFRIAPWVICGEVVPPGEVNENRYNGHPIKAPIEVEYFSKVAGADYNDHIFVTNTNTNTSTHECGENYVYKTIDTLESHSSPTPEEIKGMSPLTADRPIDSARFVAFKGIGGGTVKFDYPNIYNVSVYKKEGEKLTLKSPEEITESIKTYLKQKVAAINTTLSTENLAATAHYTPKSIAFDKLATIDPYATPKSRSYGLLSEDFFITALGEETIKALADMLYRQNLGRTEKASSTDLLTDLQNNEHSFDVNKKIANVTKNYITKQDKPSMGSVPGYQASGYELVYINSDGNDALKNTTAPDLINNIEQQKLAATAQLSSTDAVNASLDMQATERDKKCGIDADGTAPLLQWPASLGCWMKSMQEQTISDVVKVNFSNAKGPVLVSEQFKDTDVTLGDNVEELNPAWRSLTNTSIGSLSDEAQTLIAAFDNTLTAGLNKNTLSVDNTEGTTLTIASLKNNGNLNVRISGTGENCPIIEGRNVCGGEYAFQGDLYKTPRTLKVSLAGKNIGSSILTVRICQNIRCTEKKLIVPIIAGPLTTAAIITPTDKVIKRSQLPFSVMGYDAYGNPVEQSINNFRLSSSQGKIISNGNITTGIELQRFDKNDMFVLDLREVPSASAEVELTLTPTTSDAIPLAKKALTLTEGILDVKYGSVSTSHIDITLPENTSAFFRNQGGVDQLQETAVPRIVITLTTPDKKPLETYGVIKSSQGLVLPGKVKESSYTLNGQRVTAKEFSEQSSFTIKGGIATVILYPSFQAGEDILTIEIPGLPLKTIPITIHPAKPYRVGIQAPDSFLADKNTTGQVFAYDRWNNPIDTPVSINLRTIGDIKVDGASSGQVTSSNGSSSFTISSQKTPGTQYIYATLAGVAPESQLPDAKKITVLSPFWKTDNLNAMYMILAGNDRGNRWNYFSQQGNEAQDILTKSDKALAVTTLLTNPNNILPALLRINSNGQVYDASDISLAIRNNLLTYDLHGNGYIALGSTSSLTLKAGTATETFGENTIFYTARQTDSVIEKNEVVNNVIMINGSPVWSLSSATGNSAEIVNSNQYTNGDSVWNVKLQGRIVGTLRIHASINTNNIHLEDSVGLESIWLGGSTNSARGWMVYDKNAVPLGSSSPWQGGIEQSMDTDTNTSRKNTFHAATAFAEGDKVGKATQHGASPFLITLGDPLLSRQSENTTIAGTNYDGGQGKTVFTETEKSISKTIPLDVDKDGQKDLLITYSDGSARILKNKGGQDPYKDLGMLMVIDDGIKNAFAGDADGDSYEDIIIQTSHDKLRFYKNNAGTVDVDGKQICLDIPGGDESIAHAYEFFVHDMDGDKKVDIITNDTAGNIKIFYGGRTSAGDNYISKNKVNCDNERKTRQEDHMKLVKSYGVTLNENEKIYDNSLVHWKGLSLPPEVNEESPDSPLAADPQIQNLLKGTESDFSGFNIQSMIDSGLPTLMQYSASPISTLPSYEPANSAETIAYIPGTMLDDASPVVTYKQYERVNPSSGPLVDGEEIRVKTTIEAKSDTMVTYLHDITGPWKITKNSQGEIPSWNKGNLPAGSNVNWDMENGYQYMIDNISLKGGQSTTFSEVLKFKAPKLVNISLGNLNGDKATDIKTHSTDSCQKGFEQFTSNGSKNFTQSFTDLAPKMQEMQKQQDGALTSKLTEIQSKIKGASQGGNTDLSKMPGMDQILEKWNPKSLIKGVKGGGLGGDNDGGDMGGAGDEMGDMQDGAGGLDLSSDNSQLTSMTQDTEKQVDGAVQGFCKGFQAEKGGYKKTMAQQGTQAPFNVAFLSPGTYNVFGCKLTDDKGLPSMFYPGTIRPGGADVPAPYGQKSPTDGFYWAGGGSYPSNIRVYDSPAITNKEGVAMCYGSYAAGASFQNPIKHISGNCVVTAKKDEEEDTPGDSRPALEQWQYDAAEGGACNSPQMKGGKSGSPFKMISNLVGGQGKGGDMMDDIMGKIKEVIPSVSAEGENDGSYDGRSVNFNTTPTIEDENEGGEEGSQQDSETLKVGEQIKLEVQGGDVKGLVKCLMKNWLDPQIRYIINNLTTVSVNVYMPEMSSLFKGFDDVSLKKIRALYDEEPEEEKNQPTPSSRQEVSQKLFTQEGMRNNDNDVSNPFDALSTLFENVPLINISTKNINVQVPFIAQEDIVRYKAYLNNWLERNEKTAQQWNSAGGGSITSKNQELIKTVKKNIEMLDKYKEFPQELDKWLSASQRYLTEASDTVSKFTNNLTEWLQKNSRKFDQYVNGMTQNISSIKTWQALIDYSVNWKTKCGKCKVDNYDFYACTLSILCIPLPVFPIPPFRMPHLFIDLSHINMGMDVLLPKFNFVPKPIPLPQIPDIPPPPSADVQGALSVTIPKAPEIPEPPKLPELPSFTPNVELDMPNLPPAPKVPKITPEIIATLQYAEYIAKIFCIVKGGIGMVGEKGVKTRVEQLTQRTWKVEPFDSISITKIKPPLQGSDIHVDTYINMQLNFDEIYKTLEEYAEQVNKDSNPIIKNVSDESAGGGNSAGGITNTLQSFTSPHLWDLSYDNAAQARADLLTQAHALLEADTSLERKRTLRHVIALLTTPSNTAANIEGVDAVNNQAQSRIDNIKTDISSLQDQINNNYDSFVNSLQTTLVSDDTESSTLGSSLFTADKSIVKAIKDEPNPMKSYLELNKKVMTGFANALDTYGPTDLNMSLLTYNETRNYVEKTIDTIDQGLDMVGNTEPSTEKTPLLAAAATSTMDASHAAHGHSTSSSLTVQSDISQYIQGVFVKNSSGEMVNVVDRQDNIETLQVHQSRTDLNDDAKDDIIMWDDKQIRIKYSQPAPANNGTTFTRLYVTTEFSSPADIAKAVERDGRLNIGGSSFKIWSERTAPQAFSLDGQRYDSIQLRWNNDNIQGYILQINSSAEARYMHRSDKDNRKYVLILPENTDLQGVFLYDEAFGQKRVSDLVSDKSILNIQYFNPEEETLSVSLSDLPRERQYMSLAKLSYRTLNRGAVLEKSSPRSHQEVASAQLASDDLGPVPTVALVRVESKSIDGQGYTLSPVIGNDYGVVVQWRDNSGVKGNAITFTDGSSQADTGANTLASLSYRGKDVETRQINAIDHNDNIATYTVRIQWKQPQVHITDISEQTNNGNIIQTTVSAGQDKSNILFERERDGIRSTLTGKGKDNMITSQFPLGFNQLSLSGGVFVKNAIIDLHNSSGTRIGTIDKETGEISIDSVFKDSIDIQVTFTANTPRALIKEKATGIVLFSVSYAGKSALNTIVADTNLWKTQKVDDGYSHAFTNGSCIADTKNICQIYVSTKGDIWIPDSYKNAYRGTYTYKDHNITITFYDLHGKEIGNTSFIPQPLP